ncbi:tRNA (adenosine(37)-N6)-threonylcarbamoyltransferase complex transferase subunit TsaD [Marinivivus vitaminiproducens]|uniref:tRNA (adenosine(37)-N6)-threonylcarbamoyltransferase complex transferase subunit TsaD n=1 Tax=Marinivivus vitaminiproducens TaxID=3035935 RepID=UPI0027A9BE1E|nr:tRNA (adenosine(37)-N6)-threonylcarbamoyltransferase complex transferase subunit TsaD [Geminicoccaceae bacterium SCSIO 64248]
MGPVLGLETSCDDTAVAVLAEDGRILAQTRSSQDDEHAPFGGIVPEIAARAHALRLDRLIARAMAEAGLHFRDLGAIAVTAGPGLIGGLAVGVVTAAAIGSVHRLPVVPINHLEGHALTARLTDGAAFPYLLLLLSGGHSQLIAVEGVGRYRRLGTTLDDALGEAFDKVAKLSGLGFPGGPAVERTATGGDPSRYALPRPMVGQPGCHFSFSGLKTAVRQVLPTLPEGPERAAALADLCASFQQAAFDAVADRTAKAVRRFRERWPDGRELVVAGGVAANRALRRRLDDLAARQRLCLKVPPPELCTDNGVMIAWAGIERLRAGLESEHPLQARARWPLDPEAEPAPGAGVKA